MFQIPGQLLFRYLIAGIFPDLVKKEDEPYDERSLPFRIRVWNFLENPNTSRAAWTFGLFSMTAVLVSVITAAVETLDVCDSTHRACKTIELGVNMWFLTELMLRVVFSGDIVRFFTVYMNIVDILAVCPYFVLLALRRNLFGNAVAVFKILKYLRVCRLFRFSKHRWVSRIGRQILPDRDNPL